MPTPEKSTDTTDDWVPLGVFGPPHGVSGRIKVRSLTDPADAFADYAALTDSAGTPLKLRITGHAQGLAIVEIEGITDRDQAALLKGRKFGLRRQELPPLTNPDQHYSDDLIGMAVSDATGADFGTVTAVVNYGASDILEIERKGGRRELYAFTHATFPELDSAARRITIHPPEILGSKAEERPGAPG